jgi:hypothetical protein
MEGKSGSLVLVGRFVATGTHLPPSHPLIVKSRKRESDSADKLKEEYENALAVKPFVYDRKDSFAIPIWFDPDRGGYDVLWSTAMLTVRSAEADAPPGGTVDPPASSDLRKFLGGIPGGREDAEDDCNSAKRTLLDAYRLLRNLHLRCNWGGPIPARTAKQVGEEYERYLRRFGPVRGGNAAWGWRWVEHRWASPAEKTISSSESTQINPIWLVEQLKSRTWPMRLGVVHGDLHPGNIILRTEEPPAIIDFGWSKDHAHVAKDFVLMECNLRFLTLRPQVGESQLRPFVEWVAWGENPPAVLVEYLQRRAELISCVCEQATVVLGSDADWTHEYLVPLFLAAFGLLRYAPQLGNQLAAVLFVESLARHLARALKL